jgi:hypothetical protein
VVKTEHNTKKSTCLNSYLTFGNFIASQTKPLVTRSGITKSRCAGGEQPPERVPDADLGHCCVAKHQECPAPRLSSRLSHNPEKNRVIPEIGCC